MKLHWKPEALNHWTDWQQMRFRQRDQWTDWQQVMFRQRDQWTDWQQVRFRKRGQATAHANLLLNFSNVTTKD